MQHSNVDLCCLRRLKTLSRVFCLIAERNAPTNKYKVMI